MLVALDGDVGDMGIWRQTQHKSEINPKQIDNEVEDPTEQIGDGAWGDGVLARWVWGDGVFGWQSKEEMREREKRNENEKGRKKRSRRERKRKKRENIFLMREEREV